MAKKPTLDERTVVTPLFVYRNSSPVKVNVKRFPEFLTNTGFFNYQISVVRAKVADKEIYIVKRILLELSPQRVIDDSVRVFGIDEVKRMQNYLHEPFVMFSRSHLNILKFDGAERNCKQIERLIKKWKQSLPQPT